MGEESVATIFTVFRGALKSGREGGAVMAAAEILSKGDDIMTDLQFESIYETFYQLLERAKDIEDAKKAIRAILGKPE
jgi:hypothetical protein